MRSACAPTGSSARRATGRSVSASSEQSAAPPKSSNAATPSPPTPPATSSATPRKSPSVTPSPFSSTAAASPPKSRRKDSDAMKVHLASKPAMTIHRRILTKDRIVYLLVGKKPFKYTRGRSRIAYIGTSKRGARRVASSAAYRADEVFSERGSRFMDVFIVSCEARPGLKSWTHLERALLALFVARYQQLPLCNK